MKIYTAKVFQKTKDLFILTDEVILYCTKNHRQFSSKTTAEVRLPDP